MSEVFYSAVYHPYWIYQEDGSKVHNPKTDTYTRALMDFKKPENARPGKHKQAIDLFSKMFAEELVNQGFDSDEYQIVIVPSSRAGVVSESLISVAEYASDELGLEVCSSALERVVTIEALHEGGDRSQAVHIRSIEVNVDELDPDKEIVLLDDVTTSGNTLFACQTLLQRAGFESIHLFSLLRTER
ncbi:Phosphoribosyl transferase domain protein [compost metagenome]